MTARAANGFTSECDLCSVFLGAVDQKCWTPYAETAGWDILLVRKADGFQIGIQAKLRLTAQLFAQAVESGAPWSAAIRGPDCRAILVPIGQAMHWAAIADYIGLTIISVWSVQERYQSRRFAPDLPKFGASHEERRWFEYAPVRRENLPSYVPDVPAGAPAPLQLTEWKISAIKILITIERRGFVTRADFKHHGIDYRRWTARGAEWLTLDAEGYKPGRYCPDFRRQHPDAYAKIAADAERWMLPA